MIEGSSQFHQTIQNGMEKVDLQQRKKSLKKKKGKKKKAELLFSAHFNPFIVSTNHSGMNQNKNEM